MSLDFLVGFFIFITGLCIGSFLNVVILRALSGESIVYPASKCPKCQTPLKWWHNIPVISYIFLRGKCAFCKEKISIQYPIIELLTAILYLTAFLKFGYSLYLPFVFIFLSLFIVIAVTDIKECVAFDWHCYILAIAGLVCNFFNFGSLYHGYTWIFQTSFVASLTGLFAGALIIALYWGFGYLLLKMETIGIGDILIAGALGACFGIKFIIPILIFAFILQVIIVIPVYFYNLIKNKEYYTFAIFLLFIVLSVIYGIFGNNFADLVRILFTIAISVSGSALCIMIIKSMKNKIKNNGNNENANVNANENEQTSGMLKLPFGPAMVSSGLLFIFLFI